MPVGGRTEVLEHVRFCGPSNALGSIVDLDGLVGLPHLQADRGIDRNYVASDLCRKTIQEMLGSLRVSPIGESAGCVGRWR